jgi:hypothetical protein
VDTPYITPTMYDSWQFRRDGGYAVYFKWADGYYYVDPEDALVWDDSDPRLDEAHWMAVPDRDLCAAIRAWYATKFDMPITEYLRRAGF